MTQILTFARSNPKELRRFAKFLVVGAFGFVVDFGGFNLFHALSVGTALARLVPASFFPVSDYLTGHPEVIEQALSFCCAVLSNFLWNYFWLYPEARDANQASKMSKFIIVSVAGLFIGVPVFGAALYVARGVPVLSRYLLPLLPVLSLAPDLVGALGRLKARLDGARAGKGARRRRVGA